MKEEACD